MLRSSSPKPWTLVVELKRLTNTGSSNTSVWRIKKISRDSSPHRDSSKDILYEKELEDSLRVSRFSKAVACCCSGCRSRCGRRAERCFFRATDFQTSPDHGLLGL